jgi:hypothetical protein
MSDILGTEFTEEQFKVLNQNQQPPEGGGEPPEDTEPPEVNGNPNDDNNEDINDTPIKTREEILDDLIKEGVKDNQTKQEENPEDYNIKDKNKPKDEEGGDKPKDENGEDNQTEEGGDKPKDEEGGDKPKDEEGGDKPTDKQGGDLTERQRKQNEKDAKEKEKRELKKAKGVVADKINSYKRFLEKYSDVLPNKEKNTIISAKEELEKIHKSIKID